MSATKSSAITLRIKEQPVFNLIVEKQKELQIQKQRPVSFEQTIYVLLKDAYLREKEINACLS